MTRSTHSTVTGVRWAMVISYISENFNSNYCIMISTAQYSLMTTYICMSSSFVSCMFVIIRMQHCYEFFLQLKQSISKISIVWQQHFLAVLIRTKNPSKHVGVISNKTADKLQTLNYIRLVFLLSRNCTKKHHCHQLPSAELWMRRQINLYFLDGLA